MEHGAWSMKYVTVFIIAPITKPHAPCPMPYAMHLTGIYLQIPVNLTDSLLNRCIFHQVPHAAGTGAGTEAASDAQNFIHDIFIGVTFQIFSADGRLRANRDTDAAVPAGTAG